MSSSHADRARTYIALAVDSHTDTDDPGHALVTATLAVAEAVLALTDMLRGVTATTLLPDRTKFADIADLIKREEGQ